MNLFEDDTVAAAAIKAIRAGEVETLSRLLRENPELSTATITRERGNKQPYSYPLIGAAVDWPGHFPNVARTIAMLVEAGADVKARASGPHQETPLHGASSSDDVEALDALLDADADIEAPGAVIAGGTPLDDAVGFGQWQAARRLVERGAQTPIWHAAALGLMDRVEEYFASGRPRARYPWGGPGATPERDVTIAFWCACHGGQLEAARYLLDRGAELNWVSSWDGLTPLDAARRSGAHAVSEWLVSVGALPAKEPAPSAAAVSDVSSTRQGMYRPTQNLIVVLEWLNAMRDQDRSRLQGLFAEDVHWQGVTPDVACHNRTEVLDMLTFGFRSLEEYTVEALELSASDTKVVLGVRDPERTEIAGVELNGQLFTVFTVDEGRIVALRDYANRAVAIREAGLEGADWR